MEPFQNCRHLQKYKNRLGMGSAIANQNGKIWIFVDEAVQWDLVLYTEQQITLKLNHQDLGKDIIHTFVYAKCNEGERQELWNNLYQLAGSMNLPWIIGGDFNVILLEEEKLGGLPVTLNECYKESPFTWRNGRAAEDCIFKRLDRVVANSPFQELFPQIEVEHLIKSGSDHAPMILSCGEEKEVVQQNWRTNFVGSPYLAFKQKLKNLKSALIKWSRDTYGDIFQQLAIREEVVKVKEKLFEEEPSIINRIVLQKALAELKKYLNLEE
ncbi:uncharacterized protein LOC132608081 [Lycium barbarum]|uniref:uncharacterized protein LOC132608081 n=1 Tax=Lycium barbarum TaxID=112863 RepID=UPI00293E120D|nr:uncharacterized protein LOC132608081 [Lycium barbarum]